MNWWLQYKNGQGWYFTGTYEAAVADARKMCIRPETVVWIYDGQNKRVAEVTQSEVRKTFPALQGSSCPE